MNLDFLSIDTGSIIFNLANTLILFLIVKHFLFKPVNNILEQRQRDIEQTYSKADEALENAKKSEEKYKNMLDNAREESKIIIKNASETAKRHSEEIVAKAKNDADAIIENANHRIELEKNNAHIEIKNEISELALLVAEKIVEKEIDEADHRRFIDEFIENAGNTDD